MTKIDKNVLYSDVDICGIVITFTLPKHPVRKNACVVFMDDDDFYTELYKRDSVKSVEGALVNGVYAVTFEDDCANISELKSFVATCAAMCEFDF